MTEDEAKTKACPLAALSPVENEWKGFCMGSACMAWRWNGYRAEDGTWVRRVGGGLWNPENADGYCGLAGAQP